MAKILVVDDVEDNIKLLRYDLEDDGYEVYSAQNGVEALAQLEEVLPDVILLDIMMPIMDGIETCQRIKENPRFSTIPVIMLSAKDLDSDVIQGLDAGATDYIAKPIYYPIVAARVRSAVRSKQLYEQLEREKEIAESALRARSSFFATMSHEIRTPIAAIMGLADIIAEAEETSPFSIEQATQMVRSNSKYLLDLVNNILDFSKADSGKLDVEIVESSIFRIIHEIESVVSLKASEKNIDFLVEYNYPLPENLFSDPTRLKQVLINLVSNAVKFTEEGSVCLSVSYAAESSELLLEIQDTGIGMSPDEVRSLFRPFEQANDTITRRFGGTGLGLSISNTIIELLEGSINVESDTGSGSTFSVRIPVTLPDNTRLVHRDPVLQRQVSACSSTANVYSGKVLVVEDDAINQKLIKHILEKAGLEVDVANCGESGVEKALSNSFDLIFMDLHLPKLDGLAAIKLLKQSQLKVPIVALTASQDHQDISQLLQAGCEEFVPKPFEREELFACLNRFLALSQADTDSALEAAISESGFSDDDRFRQLVIDYMERLPLRLAGIETAAQESDWATVRMQAHQMAGAGLFGFSKITLISKILEQDAASLNVQQCKATLGELRVEIDRISGGKSSPQSVQ